ncbi:MAG TPA: cupin domain-containing protein [Phycisphaerae bacterium]|nr:cupin domain-containing protein [Phycisphaerae bacterium]
MDVNNIYSHIPAPRDPELFEDLAAAEAVRIERIVSWGQATPEGDWLLQGRDEWVILLAGRAGLRFEGQDRPVELGPGDYVHIPAGRRHRVEWTSADPRCVWLAVHYRGGRSDGD